MSYLQTKLKELSKTTFAPSKDGSAKAAEGESFDISSSLSINTRPLSHHKFSLFSEYIDWHTNNLMAHTLHRCKAQCEVDARMLHGKNVSFLQENVNNCYQECSNKWAGPVIGSLEKAKKESEGVFNDCLKSNLIGDNDVVRNEHVLECKSKAYMDYVERVTAFEQEYIGAALKKYA